jgi:hypothetical protein
MDLRQNVISEESRAVRIPAATLRVLLGEGALLAASFRRTVIERIWRCGCCANYTLAESEYVRWTPCTKHRPATMDADR